jgi:hypothetical protein
MRVTLSVETGDDAGREFSAQSGATLRVGRDAPCEVRVRGDSALSNPHFAVEVTSTAVRLRDWGSRFGTFRNGQRVAECDLADGDTLRAGKTQFRVGVHGTAPLAAAAAAAPAEPPPPAVLVGSPRPSRGGLEVLSREPHLYAILDAARERTLPYRMSEAGLPHESLYDGPKGLPIAHLGPWLARLPAGCEFLATLCAEGWGRSWGVFLTCDQPLKDVRHHLRRFLMVMLPEKKPAYFRYYDPRVLRVYLPTCEPGERTTFFGPITSYLCESAKGELWSFTPDQREPRRHAVAADA